MYNTSRESNLQIYHYQTGKDWDAVKEDAFKSRIIETTMKQILDSYNEFMQDLIAEAQEAY